MAQTAGIDEDMREYVVGMVTGILEDAEGATPALQEELKEAVGPVLGTCLVNSKNTHWEKKLRFHLSLQKKGLIPGPWLG